MQTFSGLKPNFIHFKHYVIIYFKSTTHQIIFIISCKESGLRFEQIRTVLLSVWHKVVRTSLQLTITFTVD